MAKKLVKTLPVAVGSCKMMRDEQRILKRKYPRTRFTLRKIAYPKGWCQVRVPRKDYEKIRHG